MFPDDSFVAQEDKNKDMLHKAKRPIKLSYLVQIMQQEGQLLIGDVAETHVLKPTVVSLTSAEDLRRPIFGMGLFKEMTEAADENAFIAYCLHGDSLAANKLIIADVAEKDPDMCIQDAHCIGRLV